MTLKPPAFEKLAGEWSPLQWKSPRGAQCGVMGDESDSDRDRLGTPGPVRQFTAPGTSTEARVRGQGERPGCSVTLPTQPPALRGGRPDPPLTQSLYRTLSPGTKTWREGLSDASQGVSSAEN